MTAATPPMKSESGFLNTRHDRVGGHEGGLTNGLQKIGGRLAAQIKQRPRRSF
jgi:hypothetical protein